MPVHSLVNRFVRRGDSNRSQNHFLGENSASFGLGESLFAFTAISKTSRETFLVSHDQGSLSYFRFRRLLHRQPEGWEPVVCWAICSRSTVVFAAVCHRLRYFHKKIRPPHSRKAELIKQNA